MEFANRFVNRWDMYPKQLKDGHYVSVKEPLRMAHVLTHLKGEITLGTYLLTKDNTARFAVLDADTDEHFAKLVKVAGWLETEGVNSYLESSRRGGHLWFFFESEVLGREARAFLRGIMVVHNLADIEMYPKQDELKDGPGSLIRLPFGIHRKTGKRYGFINPDGSSIAPSLREQFGQLLHPRTVDRALIEKYKIEIPIPERRIRPEYQNIRNAPIADIIGRYVPLKETASGFVGKCPFHEDEHDSFGINLKGNYWHCFAGCGGGDVIAFWMKYRQIDFRNAMEELKGGTHGANLHNPTGG